MFLCGRKEKPIHFLNLEGHASPPTPCVSLNPTHFPGKPVLIGSSHNVMECHDSQVTLHKPIPIVLTNLSPIVVGNILHAMKLSCVTSAL